MRIDSQLPAELTVEAGRTAKSGSAALQKTAEGTVGEDQSVLSSLRDTAEMLQTELGSVPEVRRERVEALRSAIQKGDYQVSPEQIATAMYREVAMMTGNPGQNRQ